MINQSTEKIHLPKQRFSYGLEVPADAIKEPSISKRSQELFSYLAELGEYLGHIRGRLFGELEIDEPNQRTEPNSIEGVIARACELSAMLLSQAKGIESRL